MDIPWFYSKSVTSKRSWDYDITPLFLLLFLVKAKRKSTHVSRGDSRTLSKNLTKVIRRVSENKYVMRLFEIRTSRSEGT